MASEGEFDQLADQLESQLDEVTEEWLTAAARDPLLEANLVVQCHFAEDLPRLYRHMCAHVRYHALHAPDSHANAPHASDELMEAIFTDGQGTAAHLGALARAIELLAGIVLASTVTRLVGAEPEYRRAVEIAARTAIHQFLAGLLDRAISQASDARRLAMQSCEAQLAITRAELEGALSQRQRLMAVVAHELRNLVQGLSYVARLWEKQPDNKRALLFAQTQIRDMGELLQLLLDHSTLVDARHPPSIEPFDLRALCQELAVVYEEAAAQKGLRLCSECDSAPELVLGDRMRIKQIIANLLSNAIKYTSQGEVGLYLRVRDEQRWEVHITDTGPGITSAQAARLLNGLGADQNLPGRGIGLGITKDLVGTLGGTIELTSATGEGSRFVVRLPGRIPSVMT